MRRIFLIFFAVNIMLSCKINREPIVHYIKDKQKDSLYVSKNINFKIDLDTTFLNENIIESKYIIDFLRWPIKNRPEYICYSKWINDSKKFNLDEKEVQKIIKELESSKKELKKWKKKEFMDSKVIVIKPKTKLSEGKIIYQTSKPYFCKVNNRKYALIYVIQELSSNTFDTKSKLVIMEKFNNSWMFIGEVYRK